MNTKITKWYNILLQAIIIAASYGFIYHELFAEKEILPFIDTFLSRLETSGFVILAVIAFVMVGLNWGIEAMKWKYLISKSEQISFLKAYKAVMAGITVSVFTPNRVGEYFGRIFVLERTQPVKGIFITVIGSLGQLLITLIAGSVGLTIVFPRMFLALSTNTPVYIGIIICVFLVNLLFLLLFLNVSFISQVAKRVLLSKWKTIRQYMEVFESYSARELFMVLYYSVIRYFVFTFQYYLLLNAFGVELPFHQAMVIIPAIFLIMTIIPTIALSELGIRGSVSLYLIGLLAETGNIPDHSIGIVAASTLLWIINIALPAVIGSFIVIQLRFFKSNI